MGRIGIASVRDRRGTAQDVQGGGPAAAVPDSVSGIALIRPGCHSNTALLSPFGLQLMVEASDPRLLSAVSDACRGCEDAVDPDGRKLRLILAVDHDLDGSDEPHIDVHGDAIRIGGEGVVAWADAARGEAWCLVSGDYLGDGDALRDGVLDPLILFLATRSGRAPIHAAGFLAGDRAILLAGPSGSGKSCLALAAQEAGFPLLSDDMIYVRTMPALRVWGMPRPIHVFPGDASATGMGVRLRNGKLKRAVPIRAGPAAAEDARLCVLAAGEEPALRRIGRLEALDLLGQPEAGFDLLRTEVRAALQALAARGAWLLTLSSDPGAAIRLLAATFGGPGRSLS